MSDKRFKHWQKPEIEHGKLTAYNWLVLNPDGLELEHGVDIGAFTLINAQEGVVIGEDAQVGSHCALYSASTIDNKKGKITIHKDAAIGTHCTVMPGVTIGEGAVVGAHSFVNSDIPAGAVAWGVPAKVHRTKDTTKSQRN